MKQITKTIDEICEVEYGTRVVQKRDAGYGFPVYGGGGATFQMDFHNREDRVVISRFGISKQCTRWVSGKFFLNDSGLTLRTKDPAELSQEYLDYLTLALNDEIYATAKGTAQKNVEVPALRQIKLNYPADLSLQAKLVEEVLVAFKEIDLVVENYSKALKESKKLYKSILVAKLREGNHGT
jgi:type I restriction enzyme, S subunit